MGFTIEGLGLWGLRHEGIRVQGLWFRVEDQGLGSRVYGSRLTV